MQIIIDTKADSHDDLRSAAAFLLHIVGDLNAADSVETETVPSFVPPAPIATTATVPATSTANPPSAPVFVPPPPPPSVPEGTNSDDDDETPPSNVLPFPTPPPPPPPSAVSNAAPSIATGTPVSAPAAVNSPTLGTTGPAVVSDEIDSAYMPYDARIHQKSKNKKKDGTWKLIKGIDTNIVQAVVAELAARKPPAVNATVPLPLGSTNTVPLPPSPPTPPATDVPAPPVSTSVPVPPVAAVGVVGAITYRELIDKITAATRANKVTPVQVSQICQMHGAPSLMALNAMSHLIPDVNSSIDAAMLGL